jgi:hypothetical protein
MASDTMGMFDFSFTQFPFAALALATAEVPTAVIALEPVLELIIPVGVLAASASSSRHRAAKASCGGQWVVRLGR